MSPLLNELRDMVRRRRFGRTLGAVVGAVGGELDACVSCVVRVSHIVGGLRNYCSEGAATCHMVSGLSAFLRNHVTAHLG